MLLHEAKDWLKIVLPANYSPTPSLNQQDEEPEADPVDQENVADKELRDKIDKLLNQIKKYKEHATNNEIKFKNLLEEIEKLKISSAQARNDGDIELADGFKADLVEAETEAAELKPAIDRDWRKAIELAVEVYTLQSLNSFFGEASKSAERLAIMNTPSLRPDFQDPEIADEIPDAAKAQTLAAGFYVDASDKAGETGDSVREREMLEKAIEAYEEAIKIWEQASDEFADLIDQNPNEVDTQVWREKMIDAQDRTLKVWKEIVKQRSQLEYLAE